MDGVDQSSDCTFHAVGSCSTLATKATIAVKGALRVESLNKSNYVTMSKSMEKIHSFDLKISLAKEISVH